jgi:hypothetical protein
MERNLEAPGELDPTLDARQRTMDPRHKLALRRPQIFKNDLFILEKYPWFLVERQG